MDLNYHLSFLSLKIDEIKNELKKAEIYEARIFSFKSDEVFRKDCLEENIAFIRRKNIITSLEEYKIVKRNLLKTIDVINSYDYDLERLKNSIELHKAKLQAAEEEKQKLLNLIEQQKKGNILPFRKKSNGH